MRIVCIFVYVILIEAKQRIFIQHFMFGDVIFFMFVSREKVNGYEMFNEHMNK